MTDISIKVRVAISATIETASSEAGQLAKRVGCSVSFYFNGVPCLIGPNGKPEDLVQAYRAALDSSAPFRRNAVSL